MKPNKPKKKRKLRFRNPMPPSRIHPEAPTPSDLKVRAREEVGVKEAVGAGGGMNLPPQAALAALPPEVRQRINAIVLQAQSAGIRSFLLLFRGELPGQVIIHSQEISLADAINLAGAAWVRAIGEEIRMHPEYTKEYAAIFEDARKEFVALTARVNQRVEEYRRTKPQP